MPLITPDSDWKRPAELPDLRGKVKYIAIDRETKDDGLAIGVGPGWALKHGGYICGVSAAWEGGHSFYAPIAHPDTECFDGDRVKQWELDHAAAGIRFVFHNAGYDLGWSRRQWDTKCPPLIDDTTCMAQIVDENQLSYELDALCRWRGLSGKDEAGLKEAAQAYGYGRTQDEIKGNLWRLPARYVGPYAEQDAVSTLALAESLRPEIEKQELEAAYQLEMDILPMVLEMRLRGIRIDIEKAYSTQVDLRHKRDNILDTLSAKLEHTIDLDYLRSARRLEPLFEKCGVPFPRTPKTQVGSFESDWMEDHPHWLPQLIASARQADDAANKFVGEYIIKFTHNGRIHASINQFRSEDGGTRSHRFSYSAPPLQQMPGDKNPELRDMIRTMFLPEEGEVWAKADYSQQEVRLIVHFAALLGCNKADEAVRRYREDHKTDYHTMTSELTGLPRRQAKDVTFAKAYGAGVKKMAAMTGATEEEAKRITEQYDREMPFVKQLMSRCERAAAKRGYIKLLDGARCHFDLFEAARWDANRDENGRYLPPRPMALARETWPKERLRRAFTHKAGNRLIQGSAARQCKLAMRDCWNVGLVPLLQVHDELNFSVPDESKIPQIRDLMENAVQLEVPMLSDVKSGPNWGKAK